MSRSSISRGWLCLLALPVFVECSVDVGRLRAPSHKDAASSPDLVFPFSDTSGTSDAAGEPDERNSADVATIDQGARADGSFDASTNELGGGTADSAGGSSGGETGGNAGTGGTIGTGGSMDAGDSVGGSGGTGADGGTDAAEDGTGAASAEAGADRVGGGATEDADDGAPATLDTGGTDRAADSFGNGGDDSDSALDAPESGAADLGRDTYETGGNDQADGPVASDAGADVPSRDGPGTVTCPTTINGSLDPTDLTQIGRHSRYAPASTCDSTKTFPGNGADTTYAHLYDIYHFVNTSWVPVCFNFTLTYPGDPLYAAAYSSFDPTNIVTGYLGDVGGALTSPQTMGITVQARATIDVVVYAIAMGTAAAGSYTLSCSTY